MREAVSRVELKPATDYVFVATPEIVDASFDDILGWVTDALEANAMKSAKRKESGS